MNVIDMHTGLTADHEPALTPLQEVERAVCHAQWALDELERLAATHPGELARFWQARPDGARLTLLPVLREMRTHTVRIHNLAAPHLRAARMVGFRRP